MHEFEARRIAILLEEEARYERRQRKQQSNAPDNGGFSEPGFEVDFVHGAEDTNDYTDKEMVD